MANSEAKVIYLQSHPRWVAAQRRERELQQAMHRHPAFIGRQQTVAAGGGGLPTERRAPIFSVADAPA